MHRRIGGAGGVAGSPSAAAQLGAGLGKIMLELRVLFHERDSDGADDAARLDVARKMGADDQPRVAIVLPASK